MFGNVSKRRKFFSLLIVNLLYLKSQLFSKQICAKNLCSGYLQKCCKTVKFKEKIFKNQFLQIYGSHHSNHHDFKKPYDISEVWVKKLDQKTQKQKNKYPPFYVGFWGGIVLKQHLCHVSFNMIDANWSKFGLERSRKSQKFHKVGTGEAYGGARRPKIYLGEV